VLIIFSRSTASELKFTTSKFTEAHGICLYPELTRDTQFLYSV